MNSRVAILMTDNFRAIGIVHILKDYLGVSSVISTTPNNTVVESCELFITDPLTFSTWHEFFIPKRGKTIILTPCGSPLCDNQIPCDTPQDQIIEIIGKKIEQHELQLRESKSSTLSQREIDVLKLVASGLSNKEIADNLNISTNTVMSHRKNITAKLGIKTVSGLSLFAIMNGYITSK